MKSIILVIALLGVIFSTNIWAHHAAEGIVSDEVWNSIDDNLEDAISPHLDINFDDPSCTNNLYDCMGTDVTTIDDTLYMVTTVEVDLLTPEAQADPVGAIEEYFDEAFVDAVEETNQIPSGTLGDDTATVFYVPTLYFDEYVIIELYEPIGNGESQAAAGTPDLGNRAKGG